MAKRKYVDRRFSAASRATIERCDNIINEYQAAGYAITLRQLYYQMVARGYIPNLDKEYKNLGSLINDARLAGLIDWDALEDRGRYVRQHAHWDSPADIVSACAQQFRVNLWDTQKYRPEVWVEKDALVGVVGVPAARFDVPYFSCRGYTSVTALYEAAKRMQGYIRHGQKPVIIHLGDHDPSGIDMTRDILDRLEIFGINLKVDRVALNMDQIEEFNPPPNPAKVTDSRYDGYMREYGEESWELDALEPRVMDTIITEAIESLIDRRQWREAEERQNAGRLKLSEVADQLAE